MTPGMLAGTDLMNAISKSIEFSCIQLKKEWNQTKKFA